MDDDQEKARTVARAAARRGLTAEWARQAALHDSLESMPFWEQVAGELDVIEAGAETRFRFRLLRGLSEPQSANCTRRP